MLDRIKPLNTQRVFIWLLVILIPILHSSFTIDPDIHLKFIFLSGLLLIFIGYNHVTRKILPHWINIKNPLIIICFFFISYSAVTLFLSSNVTDGIFEWYKLFISIILSSVLILYFPADVLKKELPKAFTLLSLILICSGLPDFIPLMKQGNIIIPSDTYSITGIFGHRNLFVQMLFWAFPYSVFTAIYSKEKIWNLLGSISVFTSLFFLIILSNRATWLALTLGSITIILLHIYFFYRREKKIVFKINGRDYIRILWILPLVTFVAILFYINFSNAASARAHTSDIINFDRGSTKDHLILWQKTLDVIKENPILGNGLSTWKFEILKYGNTGLESENNFTFYQTPHNDFLWVCSEQGVIGLILYVLIFVLILNILVKNLFLSENQQDFLFAGLTLFMFIGYCTYSIFSFPKERIESNIIFSLIIGVSLAKKTLVEKISLSPRRNLLIYSILLLILFGLIVGTLRLVAETHLKKALQAKAESNFPTILEEINKATGMFYKTDPTSTPLSWYAGSALFNMANYNDALIEFRNAYQINPYHVHVLNNLASCYEMLGDHKSAISYYKKAVALAPNFDDAWLNICAIYFNQEQFNEAYNALNKIPLSTKNSKFKPFLSAVLKSNIQQVLTSESNSKFQTIFIENEKDTEWFFKIHQTLQAENMTIETYIKRQ